jgi:hypothetical protein
VREATVDLTQFPELQYAQTCASFRRVRARLAETRPIREALRYDARRETPRRVQRVHQRPAKLPPPNARPASPIPRRWAVRLIRKRAELLGVVYAPDEAAAIEAAVKEFGLTDQQRKRIVLSMN